MTESQVPYTMEDLVRQYRVLKADAEALAKEQAEAMRPYREAMETIKNFVLLKLDEQGEKSVKTEAGTAYISSGIQCSVSDRAALLDYVKANDQWHLLDIGVLLEPVQEYLNQQSEAGESIEAPPGVTIKPYRRCNIRK